MKRLTQHMLFWPVVALALLLVASSIFNPSFLALTWRDGHLYGSVIDILNRAAPLMVVSLGMTLVIAVRGLDISVGAVVAIAAAVAALMIGGSFSATRRGAERLIRCGSRSPPRSRSRRPADCGTGCWWSRPACSPSSPRSSSWWPGAASRSCSPAARSSPSTTRRSSRSATASCSACRWRCGSRARCGRRCTSCCRAPRSGCSCAPSAAIRRPRASPACVPPPITLCVYTFCGLAAGIAGLIVSSNVKSADANNAGQLLELDAILAVTLGGTALTGGRFTLAGTVIGALIIQTLTSMIYSLGVPPEVNLVVKAALVFAVMLLQSAEFRQLVARVRARTSAHGASMNRRLLPLTVTIALFVAMAAFGAIRYDGFLSPQVFLNLLIDNAFLCIVAVGMTFVILSGGIDLSVGAVIALTTMISASLLDAGWNPYAAMAAGAGARRGLRRVAGLPHPALQPRAVHRDAGRHVPGARLLLSHQHRVHPDRRRRPTPPSRRRASRVGGGPR